MSTRCLSYVKPGVKDYEVNRWHVLLLIMCASKRQQLLWRDITLRNKRFICVESSLVHDNRSHKALSQATKPQNNKINVYLFYEDFYLFSPKPARSR